jgi:hypothetical protein
LKCNHEILFCFPKSVLLDFGYGNLPFYLTSELFLLLFYCCNYISFVPLFLLHSNQSDIRRLSRYDSKDEDVKLGENTERYADGSIATGLAFQAKWDKG